MDLKGFFFQPEDWLSDGKLSLCSYATKGAWMDLMCYMFKSPRVGYLMIDDKVLDKVLIRKMLKCSDEEFETIWTELIDYGVMKRNESGCYYSKRLVKDMERISLSFTANDEEAEMAQKVLDEFKRFYPALRAYHDGTARSAIIARKREGATFEDFKAVIVSKTNEWKDVEKMVVNIKPTTLFGDKFSRYLAEAKNDEAPPNPYAHLRDHSYD